MRKIVWIQLAVVTDHVCEVDASVALDGVELLAVNAMREFSAVFRLVLNEESMISILENVFVIHFILAMIVRKWYVPGTVVHMVYVRKVYVDVTMVGPAPCVIKDHVILGVMTTDNARMVLVYVRKDGTADIVLYPVVQMDVHVMDNVFSKMGYTGVLVQMVGPAPIVQSRSNYLATTTKIMTKMA